MVRTGERFGTEHLINILCGEETEAIQKVRPPAPADFGVGKEHNKLEWRSIFRQLYGAGIVSLEFQYGRWKLTDLGRAVLKGAAKVELRKDRLQSAAEKAQRKKAPPEARPELAEADRPLFERLRQQRTRMANTQRVPAYVIFADRSLLEMAKLKPTTMEALSESTASGRPSSRSTARRFSRWSAIMSSRRGARHRSRLTH